MKDYIKYLLVTLIGLWLLGFWYMIEIGSYITASRKKSNEQGSNRNYYDLQNEQQELLIGAMSATDESKSVQDRLLSRIRRIEAELKQLDDRNKENDLIIRNLRSKEKKFLKILSESGSSYSLEKSDLADNFPSKQFEDTRRKTFNDLRDMSLYMNAQLEKLTQKTDLVDEVKNNFNHRISVLMAEMYNISIGDNLGEWRRKESLEMAKKVQKHLHELQNPSNCESSKKLVCDLTKGCGFGCQMHHILYCFIAAFYSKRTLILESVGWQYNSRGFEQYFRPLSDSCTKHSQEAVSWNDEFIENKKVVKMPIIDLLSGNQKFLPLSVPKEYYEQISRFHGDPFVWWAGQMLTYIMRFNANFEPLVNKTRDKFKSDCPSPCVGVHVRRTDKIGSEAAFHSLDEYMKNVQEYFRLEELKRKPTDDVNHRANKNVYLASDDPSIFEEATSKYSKDYNFIYEKKNAQTAQLSQRYSPDSAQGVILDIYLLSQCDYLVCTFSSQVCRMAYELMQVRYPDASWRYSSLDDVYYFGGQNAHNVRAIYEHAPNKEAGEIELKVGDTIGLAGNHWNGYSKGRNKRTNQEGLFPTYKVIDIHTQF